MDKGHLIYRSRAEQALDEILYQGDGTVLMVIMWAVIFIAVMVTAIHYAEKYNVKINKYSRLIPIVALALTASHGIYKVLIYSLTYL